MEVWNKRLNSCCECPYYDGDTCSILEVITHKPSERIHKDCPFNKPITKKVIEGLGWIKSDEQILPKDIIGCYDFRNDINKEYHGVFRETHTTILRWDLTGMEYKWVQIFSGRLNNPEELKFILKRLNIIE